MNSEIKSKKWLFAGIGLQFAVGFTVSFLVYFFGTLFAGANFGASWMVWLGWLIVAIIACVITLLIMKKNKELKKEYALNA